MEGIPAFLTENLREQYGAETAETILAGYAARRPVTLRVNTLRAKPSDIRARLAEAGIRAECVPWYPDALILCGCREADVQALPMYERGEIYLQSLSSMLPPLFLAPQKGECVLDMAAAPGGKTTQMAALSGGLAQITACEINAVRFERLRFNAQRQGAGRVVLLRQDARRLDDAFSFDKILLDAPCSGSGTLRAVSGRLQVAFSPALVENSARLQQALLRKALRLLKPGHDMIYSTCSVLRQENEDVLRRVLPAAGADIVPLVPDFPDGLPRLPASMPGVLLIAPDERFEGFFVAKIRRRHREGRNV